MDAIPEFPTIDEVKTGIEYMSKIKWDRYNKELTIEENIKRVRGLLDQHFKSNVTIFFEYEGDTLPLRFYRCRPLDTIMNINLIREHSYPPINQCVNPQRANLPYHPVFYCSDNLHTCLFETIRTTFSEKKEREYCISLWKIRKKTKTVIAPFLLDLVDESNVYRQHAFKQIYDRLPDLVNEGIPADRIPGIIELMKFYSRVFVSDSADYPISSFLAHEYLYAAHSLRTDIFLYPSVIAELKTINMAVHPNFVDDNMYLAYLLIASVNYLSSGEVNVRVTKYGTVDNGRIEWKGIHPDDHVYRDIQVNEFKAKSHGTFEKL
jgi:hypothetical protein